MSFFVSIIPFVHSIGVNPLIYSGGDISMDHLRIGQVVEIPYGNHIENGVITEIHIQCPIDIESEAYVRIKPIHRIITHKILLTSSQINMIQMMANHYMIAIHRVLAIFLTRPILTRLERKDYQQLIDPIPYTPPNRSQDPIHQIHIVQDSIVTPAIVERYIGSGPTLIILPDEYAMIPYQQYHENQGDILFVSGDLTDVRRAQAWIDIANGKFSTVYGTRRIIYYNLAHYSHIIYIEDALGPDYWHYPIRIRYSDILDIFQMANIDKNITILTSVPTLTTLANLRHYPIANISALCKKI